MGRVRVLRIISRLNVGGPAIHTTLLTTRLDPARYESALVTGTEEEGEGNYLTLRGLTVPGLVRVPGLGREIRGLQEVAVLRRLVDLMRRFRPDIVHTHAAKAGAIGRVAAKLCRGPVIVHTYHGHVLRAYFSPARTRVFIAIERALARVTTQLVAVSPRVRDEVLGFGIGRRECFTVVPLGLDLGEFSRSEALRGRFRASIGVQASAPLVGIVARLAPVKAHEVFLEAARLLLGRLPDAHFVVAGDGPCRDALEAQAAALGLLERVHFLGWRRDLAGLYADLDVVVLTSRNEGSPVALIEAMAAARPVVATSVGGVPDVVTDNATGRLVPSDDPRSLAEAVWDLVTNRSEADRLGRAARDSVLSRFGAERLVSDVDALYQGLLVGERRP